jgi:transcriptional regulator with XRE-family HTH domain
LAQVCNVSNVSISKIECGKTYPKSKLLNKIAEALSISSDMILNKAFLLDDTKLSKEKIEIFKQLKTYIDDILLRESAIN